MSAKWVEVWPQFEAALLDGAHSDVVEALADARDEIRKKLSRGHDTYGDGHFNRSAADLALEINEELVDVPGWGVLAWAAAKNDEDMRKCIVGACRAALLIRNRFLDGVAHATVKGVK